MRRRLASYDGSELMGWSLPAGVDVWCLLSAAVALTKDRQMALVHILVIQLAKRSFQDLCSGAYVDAPI